MRGGAGRHGACVPRAPTCSVHTTSADSHARPRLTTNVLGIALCLSPPHLTDKLKAGIATHLSVALRYSAAAHPSRRPHTLPALTRHVKHGHGKHDEQHHDDDLWGWGWGGRGAEVRHDDGQAGQNTRERARAVPCEGPCDARTLTHARACIACTCGAAVATATPAGTLSPFCPLRRLLLPRLRAHLADGQLCQLLAHPALVAGLQLSLHEGPPVDDVLPAQQAPHGKED